LICRINASKQEEIQAELKLLPAAMNELRASDWKLKASGED
jgi:hypothetical protein